MKNRALNKYIYDSKLIKSQHLIANSYYGHIQGTDKSVYVKMIPSKTTLCTGVKSYPQQINHQVQTFSKLKDQYISNIVQVVETQNHMFIVSERGVFNLMDCQNKKLNDIKIFEIFLDMVIGVCYLRSKGYLHYNLVPGIIQIQECGAKIGGIEFCYHQKQVPSHKIVQMKKWEYLSPQQLKNQAFTQKTMIWNLGVILHSLIFNKLPYQAKNKDQLLIKIFRFRNTVKQDVSPFLQTILLGCLRSNPLSRYSLNQLLRCLLSNQQIEKQFQKVIKGKMPDLQFAYTLPQADNIFQEQNIEKQVDNQIGYIYFLDRTCFLISKMQMKIQDPPILSLTQYIIRCRLHKVKKSSYWKSSKVDNQLKYSLDHFMKVYGESLSQEHLKKLSPQKYNYFRQKEYKFKQIIYLQYQAFLREFIQKVTNELMKRQSPYYHGMHYTIYALDFTISIFQLSQDLISQNQNQSWRKLGHNYMRNFAQNPLTHNMPTIFKDILQKIDRLNLMSKHQ